jgi:quaternary ammonium compound-resistance protein SugE
MGARAGKTACRSYAVSPFDGISGALLFLAQKEIALGTAYAVWTGIGAAGTFLIGIWLFGDPGSLGRYLGVVLIIAGVVTLKLAH